MVFVSPRLFSEVPFGSRICEIYCCTSTGTFQTFKKYLAYVDEAKGRPNPFRDKKSGKHRRRQVEETKNK